MEAWKSTLIDLGLLWSIGTLVTFCWILSIKKQGTVLEIIGISLTHGAIGAGAGISVIEKLGLKVALGLAVLFTAGFISRDWLAKKLGFGESGHGKDK
jgi:hypothetical protein